MRKLPSFALPLLFACATTTGTEAERTPVAIEVHPVRGTDRYRVLTDGLARELAVEGVAEADLPFARALVAATADGLREGPFPGAIVDLELGPAVARVQLVSATGDALLVVDVPPTGASVHPVAALATVAFSQAWEAWRSGDDARARALALDAVRLHRGDPLRAGAAGGPPRSNHENHLSWALLAQLSDGAERERWYLGALERSSRYLTGQLGATPEQLLAIDRPTLLDRAQRIVEENLEAMRAPIERGGAGGPVEIPSPIRSGDAPQTVLLPAPFLTLYAKDPGASLLWDEAWRALAVDAFERLRSDPVELLLATREIRSIYLRDDLLAPTPPPAHPADKMLSALLADVARKGAAGLTPEEVAATLGATADPRVLGGARRKLAEQRDRETAWYAEALRAAQR